MNLIMRNEHRAGTADFEKKNRRLGRLAWAARSLNRHPIRSAKREKPSCAVYNFSVLSLPRGGHALSFGFRAALFDPVRG
jgi:hypothetical protein